MSLGRSPYRQWIDPLIGVDGLMDTPGVEGTGLSTVTVLLVNGVP